MNKLNRLLLMLIAMVAIMIAAVGIDRGIEYWDARKWEKERVERYEQAYAEVSDIQMTISELSQDQQAITAFIEENKEYFEKTEFSVTPKETKEEQVTGVSENGLPENVSENTLPEDVSENGLSGDVSEKELPGDVSENELSGDVSENELSGDVSENELPGDVSENELSGDVSENELSGDGSENELSGDVSENELPGDVSENTLPEETADDAVSEEFQTEKNEALADAALSLQERREQNSSYIETQNINQRDRQIIAASEADFSQLTIACLGDSITQASNLEKLENYQQYSYPSRLEEILGAEAVYNLGIGGSSIGRYWENAFVDRYREIPQDTDIIIVMGGTNDGFCVTQEELGNMEERAPRTFIGDLDELMKGLKTDYPDAMIVFATPLPNVLHDMLRKEREYLLPQKEIVDSIKLLAKENDIPVIDLYNSNLLDSHDAAVIFNYMPDGVHGNETGYQILAEHMAAELIGLYEGELPADH